MKVMVRNFFCDVNKIIISEVTLNNLTVRQITSLENLALFIGNRVKRQKFYTGDFCALNRCSCLRPSRVKVHCLCLIDFAFSDVNLNGPKKLVKNLRMRKDFFLPHRICTQFFFSFYSEECVGGKSFYRKLAVHGNFSLVGQLWNFLSLKDRIQ